MLLNYLCQVESMGSLDQDEIINEIHMLDVALPEWLHHLEEEGLLREICDTDLFL